MRWIVRLLALVGAFTVLVMVAVAAALLRLSPGREVELPDRVVLELDLERPVVEEAPEIPLPGLLGGRRPMALWDLLRTLRHAAEDDRVAGLVVRLGDTPYGMAQAQELRAAIADFAASGKPVVAHAETYGEVIGGTLAYYVATAASRVALQPSGDVGLAGLAGRAMFLRGALDKLGIEPEFGQRHEYKNAANTFTERGFTPAHREALDALVGDLYEQVVAGIAEGRGLAPARVDELVAGGPYLGPEALELGLVDRLAYYDEVRDALLEEAGEGAEPLYLHRYAPSVPDAEGPVVALVTGRGQVHRGPSERDPFGETTSFGSATVSRALRLAAEDDDVRAIVLRVDSPGGSYVASDTVWHEVRRIREETGKPVVVSMGNVAASGGYFVAAGADAIVADPGTITGSIGVLAGKLVSAGLWDKLGIAFGTVKRGPHADMWSGLRPFTEEEWARLEAFLDRVYDDFVGKVAEGRGLERAEVERVARGRVWTGRQALERGLVDELGGLSAAVARAAELAGIEGAPAVVRYPRSRNLLEQLLEEDPASSRSSLVRLVEAWNRAAALLREPGVAELPWRLELR